MAQCFTQRDVLIKNPKVILPALCQDEAKIVLTDNGKVSKVLFGQAHHVIVGLA
jgi:hypothetical protein